MPTIEVSEKPRSPNSSRAASRILRSVRSPRAVRGVLLPSPAIGRTRSSAVSPIRLPYRDEPYSQVETRFNFHYDINLSAEADRKSTRLNSSHQIISYAVFCLKKKNKHEKSI